MHTKIFFALSGLLLFATAAAFAQVSDDFSDGNFTQNPTWSGDTDKFVVVPYALDESNLVLRSNNSGAATYYLSTPNTLMDDTFWEFFINLRFQMSGANIVDVFLAADNPNLLTAQNGYFLKFGRTARDISFWRRQGGVDTELLTGPPSQVNSSSNNPFNVRVTRSAEGFWNIQIDQGANGIFQNLGFVTDNAVSTSSAIGVRILQSTAQGPINNHWFDNFVVDVIPPDVSPPNVVNVQALSATQAVLTFDEPLDPTSAGNTNNYFVNGGIGNPASAVFDNATLLNVTLTFAQPLTAGQFYSLTVSDVEDLVGNEMPPQTLELVWFTISEPGFREIVFNELMVDETPVVGLPQAEFIELYNTTSDKFFDLSGYTYVNGTSPRILESTVLFPNSYVILCRSTDVSQFEVFGTVQGLVSWPALTNSADSLTLLNLSGDLVDVVAYTTAWYQDASKVDGGWTLEQINPFAPCSGMSNWRASEAPQGGTPGAENSIFDDSPDTVAPQIAGFEQVQPDVVRVIFNEPMDVQSLLDAEYEFSGGVAVLNIVPRFDQMAVSLFLNEELEVGVAYALTISGPEDCAGNALADDTVIDILFGEKPQFGDIIISEIMADPTPAIGLPAQEYFELFNAGDKVIDIQGCNLSGQSFNFPRLLMPGEYLMCVSSSALDDFSAFPDAYVMQGMSLTFLTNGGRELLLSNQDGDLINAVTYSSTWYRDPAKANGGWSLEIINPFTECSGAQNWIASNSPLGGTPGAQNSVFNDTPDTTPPVFLGFFMEAPDLLVLRFNELMDVEALINGSYLFSDGIAVLEAQPLDPPTEVLLQLSENLEAGPTFTLTVNGLLDCSLNPLPETVVDVQLGVAPQLHDLLISEIMADPTPQVQLPPSEYFELYNASDKVIELQGLTLATLNFTRPRLVQPGAYVICAAESQRQEFFSFQGVYFIDGMSSTFLTNGGRELPLRNSAGALVDRVNYDLSWYRDRSKEDGGWSLERINLDEPCRAGDNWTASVDPKGGTPGEVNSVNDPTPDTTPPQVSIALATNPNTVEVRFNEVLDPQSFGTNNFSIADINIIGASTIDPDNVAILLTLGSNLQTGTIYTLTINGVADCVGNSMEQSTVVSIALPQVGEVGDIIINEVLFNAGTDGGVEFVEVVNISDKAVGLQNWSLGNQSGTVRTITEDPLVIFPGAYMVFTSNPDVLIQRYPKGRRENFLTVATPQFTNTSGSVILLNPLQEEMDRFDYQERFHLTLLRSYRGVSLERLSFTRPTNDPGNWTSAAENVGFATPGYLNSQFLPEGISAGSFELDNEVFSPDNDGFQDVLLINYTLDNPGFVATIVIYDRRGRIIRNLVNNQIIGTQGTISWDGTTNDRSKARIGPHIILVELFDLQGKVEYIKLPCIVAGRLGG